MDRLPGTETGTEWQDPEILDLFSRGATRVTLTDGQRPSLALKMIVR